MRVPPRPVCPSVCSVFPAPCRRQVGSHAAIVTTRAGRIIRLVRVIRILRMISVVTRLASALLHRWGRAPGKEADKTAPSNIGSKLTDATTMQVSQACP